ncbi:MAG: ABC transporter substrate-binding protein [Promethearchaeota archaeon]|jgi:ABC-type transport system substrate-binding protein
MEMEKKNLAIIILAVVLAASGIGNVILAVFGGLIVGAPSRTTLVYGLGSNPAALDPVDTWDIPSHPLQDQVTESLVEYDLTTHPGYEIKPELATEWKWLDNKTVKFRIRDDVWFHDGNKLTAAAVQWNFERANWFFNGTGTLPANATSWEGFPSSLYKHSVTGQPIFKSFSHNEADTWDDGETAMTFTVELNFVFGAFIDLLCFGAIKMLSPASTPRWKYLDLADDVLVGTGPYKYIHFKRDREVRMERFERWWGTNGYFEVVIFRIIEDTTARMTAGLAGQFDYVGGVPGNQIDTFKALPEFHVEDVGEDLCYFYLEIYSGPKDAAGDLIVPGDHQYQKNPPYLRRALALAINYTYIYEEIQGGYAVEGVPAVPRAFAAHNSSVVQAHDSPWAANVVTARQLLIDNAADIEARGGIDVSGFSPTTDSDWTGKNILGRTLGINRHFGSTTNLRLNQLMTDNFDLLGIQLTETIREWGDYLDTGENNPETMDIGYIGWCPDYLNPFNMIDPLFNLASHSSFSRINDTSPGGLTDLMNAGGAELNLTLQGEIWKKVQSYIYDVNRPLNPASHTHISGWVFLVQSIHKDGLIRDEYNVMSNWHIERWYYEE